MSLDLKVELTQISYMCMFVEICFILTGRLIRSVKATEQQQQLRVQCRKLFGDFGEKKATYSGYK